MPEGSLDRIEIAPRDRIREPQPNMQMRLQRWLAGAGVLGFLLLAMPPVWAGTCPLEAGPARSVVAVLDGATLRLDDGSEVRLAGIASPSRLDSGGAATDWPPASAASEALSALVLGRVVELAFAETRSDRHGRIVAHLFRRTEHGHDWIQGRLLAAGHARAILPPGDASCADELLAHEGIAASAGLGLWSHTAYRTRRAERTYELMRYRSTYQTVAGRIAAVAEVRGVLYLNFGREWREDFTVVVRSDVRARLAARGLDVAGLAGREVKVRGWIERRNGPAIQLQHAAELELLTEGAGARGRPETSSTTPGDGPRRTPGPRPGPAEGREAAVPGAPRKGEGPAQGTPGLDL